MLSFEKDIWPQIVEMAQDKQTKGEPFFTASKNNKNTIVRISSDSIVVQSEIDERGKPVGSPRPVYRECLEEAWTILKRLGQMSRKDMLSRVSNRGKYKRTGSIIFGILSELNGVRKRKIGQTTYLIFNQ